mmetsp:Transcript_1802/g.6380  ORF Transcript_1802/g.6380 Transcript_1802/m.6380 type:complete len:128 (-) Transcript_1802:1607-1990(-)
MHMNRQYSRNKKAEPNTRVWSTVTQLITETQNHPCHNELHRQLIVFHNHAETNRYNPNKKLTGKRAETGFVVVNGTVLCTDDETRAADEKRDAPIAEPAALLTWPFPLLPPYLANNNSHAQITICKK